MAFTITDQGATTNTTGTTIAKTPASNIASGSTIVVLTYEQNSAGTVGTMADDAGNTYTKATDISPNATSSNGREALWYCINCSGVTTAQNITYTKTGSVAGYIGIVSATAGGTIGLDATATPTTGSSTSPSITVVGTTGTEWYIAGSGFKPNSAGDTFTQATGWNNGPDHVTVSGGGSGAGGGNRTGTGSQTWNPTITSRPWGCLAIVFKETVASNSLFRQNNLDGMGTGGGFFDDPLAG